MEDHELLERISVNPEVMTGKPVIKGTRLSVAYVLGLLAHGASFEEVMDEYEGVEEDDIRACLLFAEKSLEDHMFVPLFTSPE
jgi:uncharacterized protein (DUF433 family)